MVMLRTISLPIVALTTSLILVALYIALYLGIEKTSHNWENYRDQTTPETLIIRSLISGLGYEGLANSYQNYLIYRTPQYKDRVLADIENVRSLLSHQRETSLSLEALYGSTPVELALLEYRRQLINQDNPAAEVQMLSTDVIQSYLHSLLNNENQETGLSATHILAIFGYGGVQHHLKNYIRLQDQASTKLFEESINKAENTLANYRLNKLSPAEEAAIQQLEVALAKYKTALKKIPTLYTQGLSVQEVDQIIDTSLPNLAPIFSTFRTEALYHSRKHETQAILGYEKLELLALASIFIAIVKTIFASAITRAFQKNHSQLRLSLRAEMAERQNATSEIRLLNEELENRVIKRTEQLRIQIQNREAAEQNLKESKRRIQAIIDTAADCIVTVQEDGAISSMNMAAEEMFGIKQEDAIGKDVDILVPIPEIKEGYSIYDVLSRMCATSQKGKRNLVEFNQAGLTIPLEIAVSKTQTSDAIEFTVIARNILEQKEQEEALRTMLTELKEAQTSLIQSEKLAALGSLVAGVAHEVNTPLGIGVTASSHLSDALANLKEIYDSGDITQEDLEKYMNTSDQAVQILVQNLKRAAELVRSFKQVATDQSNEEARVLNLRQYIDDVLLSLRPQLKQSNHNIQVICPEDLEIKTLPGSIGQIITNLVTNSVVHAYGEREHGTIMIKVATVSDDTIELTYRDDGKGIPSHLVSKVFDPFVTTKRGQGGTGLGLHILHNIVTQKLGGTVHCSSTEGEGAQFTIRFPLHAYESAA